MPTFAIKPWRVDERPGRETKEKDLNERVPGNTVPRFKGGYRTVDTLRRKKNWGVTEYEG